MNRNQTRVDLPHVAHSQPGMASRPSREVLLQIAGRVGNSEPDLVHRQAEQLAMRLHDQQRELDRREADFNARAARMENELRTARLVYREREFSILAKQREFDQRLNELRQRNADMVAAQCAIETEANENRQKHTQQLDESRVSVEMWQKRLRDLENDERSLNAKLEELDETQRMLDEQKQELMEREGRLGQESPQIEAGELEAVAKEREQLSKRSEQLERRRVAVQQLHGDVSRMYREGLEIRIATEELWGEMADNVSPEEITQRLADFRSKLNDQYALANLQLVEQQDEIRSLIGRLGSHETRLTRQRDEVRGWVARRQMEIEQQASRLLEREQELNRQGTNMRHFERQWQRDRDKLEQEVKRLQQEQTHVMAGEPSV